VLQHPSRKNPVMGSVPHGSSGPPSTLRSVISPALGGSAAGPSTPSGNRSLLAGVSGSLDARSCAQYRKTAPIANSRARP
jgi:hypothetical protein